MNIDGDKEALLKRCRDRRKDKWIGYGCLVVLIFSWVLQAELSQILQGKDAFNKPFFIVGLNHSILVSLFHTNR